MLLVAHPDVGEQFQSAAKTLHAPPRVGRHASRAAFSAREEAHNLVRFVKGVGAQDDRLVSRTCMPWPVPNGGSRRLESLKVTQKGQPEQTAPLRAAPMRSITFSVAYKRSKGSKIRLRGAYG